MSGGCKQRAGTMNNLGQLFLSASLERSSSCFDLPGLNIKKDLRDCPVTSFQLCFKNSQQFLRRGDPGSLVLNPNSNREAVFHLLVSHKLSFEETISKKD